MVASTIDFGTDNATADSPTLGPGRYYEIASPPGMADPATEDVCFVFWFRTLVTGQSQRRGVYTIGGIGANDSINLLLAQYGDPAGNDWYIELVNFIWDHSGNFQYHSAGSYRGSNQETDLLCVWQIRSGNAMGYVVPIGATGVTEPSGDGITAWTNGAVIPTTSAMIGKRIDSEDFYLCHPFGEFAIINGGSLSASQVEAVAAGAHLADVYGGAITIDLRFRASNATEPDLSGNAYDAIQHGTGWATTTEFFPDGASTTPITNDADFRWNVLQAVQQGADLRWSVLANIIKDSDLRWSILKLINKDVDLRWSVLQMIYRDLELRWDSDGSNSTVFSDATLQWSIIATIAQSLTLDWNVLQTITHDADIRWAILSAVAKDFEARWDVRQALQADANIEWNIIGTAAKTITLRWNIQSETSFEDISGVITVNSATGKITALTKTPVITTL